MLHLLDKLLQDLLMDGVPSLRSAPDATVDTSQISVTHPDETWKGSLSDPKSPGLNVYLAELRENVRLRSPERSERQEDGKLIGRRAPYRLDCHYLISAYSPADQSAPTTPTTWEHQLLYEATTALVRSRYLKPSELYPPGISELLAWPERMRDHEMPIEVNPAAGFHKLAEFWGTMPGSNHPWRPVVYLVITIPVEMRESRPIEVVRHTIVDCGRLGLTNERLKAAKETLEEVGGVVLDNAGNVVPKAWVVLEDDHHNRLARTTTDAAGKFVLPLMPSARILYAAAFGLGQSDWITDVADSQRLDHTLRFK